MAKENTGYVDNQPPTLSSLMSVADLANRLGISEKTTWRYLAEGRIGCIRLGKGRKVFVSEEQFEEFLTTYAVPAAKPETTNNGEEPD